MAVTATALGKATTSASTANCSITCAAAAPIGALVVAMIVSTTNSTSMSAPLSDSQSNTWRMTTAPNSPGNSAESSLGYSVLTTALSTSDTITFASGGTSASLALAATAFTGPTWFSGATILDKAATNKAQASSSNLSTPATSATSQPNELVIGAFDAAGSGTYSGTNGYTLDPNGTVNQGVNNLMVYLEVSTAGAQTATANQPTAGGYDSMIATFQEVAGGQPFIPHRMPLGA